MTAVIEPRVSVATAAYPHARVDAIIRTIGTVFLWASLVLVGYWWAAGGGIADLTSWEGALNSIGRLTGLVASDLLLIQVLLIARIPPLERAFGQDRVVRMHRLIGLTSINLLVAHIVLNTWGYAGGRLLAWPATLWDLTWNYPGMLLAVAGAACLGMVVVTSLRAARKRLRYESWHLLHLYAYLGVGLALPHQLWTGQEFLNSAAATVYWWTFWAVAAGSVLVFRVGLPLWRTWRHRLRVTSVVPEGDGVTSVYLTGHRMSAMNVESGQFFVWRFMNRDGWTRGNPYSLSAAPDGRSLRISVKALGDNSARTSSIKPGTTVLVEGPYGRLSPRARTRDKVAFIGAGVGIAPLRALAEGMEYQPGEAVLVYRYSDEPIFEREFGVLVQERGLRCVFLPGKRRGSESWATAEAGAMSDSEALRRVIPDVADRDVYICGPEGWTDAARRAALDSGVADEQIHIETFGW